MIDVRDVVRQKDEIETQEYYISTTEWNPESGLLGNDNDPPHSFNLNVDAAVNESNAMKKASTSTKKQKYNDELGQDERLVDMVSTLCSKANNCIGILNWHLETEFGDSDRRILVCDVVEFEGLDANEQLVITQHLHNNPKDMELFFSRPKFKHGRMVRLILDDRF
ncbi:hypothetical protein Salat_0222100 [Sesamum alatum]|uniref:Uncharacterized protein n=1 Tax=Sesamum alatum TaxID=300844 RepID=A0AAE2CYA8_9LAMI|nr:hypothetical protein Salat_0222100 [Sesamum alatum]